MRIPGSDESTDVFVEKIPYFAKRGHDCLRPTENLANCVQRKANEILTINSVGRSECFLLAALLVTVCIAVVVARVITDPGIMELLKWSNLPRPSVCPSLSTQ